MHICVIGAGVIGLTIAYELTRKGHAVTIMEKDSPFAGASHRSFAWINANFKRPASYHHLNAFAVQEHIRFQEEFPSDTNWLTMSGNILVDFSENRRQTYAGRISAAREFGSSVRQLNRDQLISWEPTIDWPYELESAVFFPDEGYLENDILAREILSYLENNNVQMHQTYVERIESTAHSAKILTMGEEHVFDHVVIATGADSRLLAARSGFELPVASLDHPTSRTHSFLGLSEPVNILPKHVIISDRVNVRPRHDDRMWVQVPYVEHRVQEGESRKLLDEVSMLMERELSRLFSSEIAIERVIFSGRSFPEDGRSIVGFVDKTERIYAAVTHSGMTLAPLLARLTAEELEGRSSPLLDDFRPSRFIDGIESVTEPNFIGKQ